MQEGVVSQPQHDSLQPVRGCFAVRCGDQAGRTAARRLLSYRSLQGRATAGSRHSALKGTSIICAAALSLCPGVSGAGTQSAVSCCTTPSSDLSWHPAGFGGQRCSRHPVSSPFGARGLPCLKLLHSKAAGQTHSRWSRATRLPALPPCLPAVDLPRHPAGSCWAGMQPATCTVQSWAPRCSATSWQMPTGARRVCGRLTQSPKPVLHRCGPKADWSKKQLVNGLKGSCICCLADTSLGLEMNDGACGRLGEKNGKNAT